MHDALLANHSHLYEHASIGLCCFDTHLRYVQINRWLAAINGRSVEEHLGRGIEDVIPHVAASVRAERWRHAVGGTYTGA